MKDLSQVIFEKLHINKHINISPKDDEKKYVIFTPKKYGKFIPEEYLIYEEDKEIGFYGPMRAYVLSFNELKDVYENHPDASGLYVCEFNKNYINKLDDIKKGKIKILSKNDLGEKGIGYVSDIIKRKI